MKKRILALPGVFLPHNETITQMSYKILCNLDYDIDVIAFKATIDESFQKILENDSKYKKMHIHYIDVDWKSLDINSKNMNIFKIKKYIRMYEKECMKYFEKYKYDAVFSFSVPNYTHYAAYKIKKKYKENIKWFASFSDPISNNIYIDQFRKEKLRTKILYLLLKFVSYKKEYEKCAVKYADKLLFISEELKKNITDGDEKFDSKSIIYPITYVKQWPSYKLLSSKEAITTTNTNNNKIVLSHFGNIYGLRKIDKFLDALYQLIEDEKIDANTIEINQYGDVDKKQISFFNDCKYKNILRFHERVDYNKCIELMKQSDILLIFDTIVDDNVVQPFLPSKITDYLLTNKPIFAVTTKNSPLYDIINKKHICVGYDVESIKDGLLKQISNVNNVNNDIKQFDNDYVSKKVFKNLLEIIYINEEE